jgi:HSP20 family protein
LAKREASTQVEPWTDLVPPMPLFSGFTEWSPFRLMHQFSEQMDRIFRASLGVGKGVWAPIVDVQQSNGTLEVTAELPGLKKEEVKVELSDDSLIIEGERKREHKEDHEGGHRWERSYGRFYRSIPLPEGAKRDQLKAELSDGILKVSLPVPESKKKRTQVAIEEKKTKMEAA